MMMMMLALLLAMLLVLLLLVLLVLLLLLLVLTLCLSQMIGCTSTTSASTICFMPVGTRSSCRCNGHICLPHCASPAMVRSSDDQRLYGMLDAVVKLRSSTGGRDIEGGYR